MFIRVLRLQTSSEDFGRLRKTSDFFGRLHTSSGIFGNDRVFFRNPTHSGEKSLTLGRYIVAGVVFTEECAVNMITSTLDLPLHEYDQVVMHRIRFVGRQPSKNRTRTTRTLKVSYMEY